MAGREDYQLAGSAASVMSFGTDVKYDNPKFHLVLVQKKELPSERPIIDSTKWQRLSFYRAFASTTSKTGIIATQQVEINSFLWFYTLSVFFKTLPHSFVHFFLAAYAPEEHTFAPKMVPFCYGLKYLYIMVAFIELVVNTDTLILTLHYCIAGIIHKNPWNRCIRRRYYDEFINGTMNCYLASEMPNKFLNKTNIYFDFHLLSPENENFQVSTIDYYRIQIMRIAYKLDIPLFLTVWISIQLLHLISHKRLFWKILDLAQWTVNIFNIFSYVYLISGIHQFEDNIPIATITSNKETSSSFWTADLEMLAESITAPPVVHVLTARSTQEIDPAKDSTCMVVSNAIIYIFKGLLSNRLKLFGEKVMRTEIPITQFNQHTGFFLWPLFWQSFYLGDVFSIIHNIINYIVEIFILVVIYQCTVETIVYEWVQIKRWMVMVVFNISGVLMYLYTTVDSRVVLWIYGKGIATLAETVFVYVMYPIGRLVDDFTFYYGVPPTKLRIMSLRLVPVFYICKLYLMLASLWEICATTPLGIEVHHFTWSWSLMVAPVFLGMLYAIYRYLIVYRMTWSYIFRPIPKWGPRDFSVRQLRKQFDSRFYISSEVPKLLSRYLTSKRESKVYKVDVRYDFQRRSTVSKAVGFSQKPRDDGKLKSM